MATPGSGSGSSSRAGGCSLVLLRWDLGAKLSPVRQVSGAVIATPALSSPLPFPEDAPGLRLFGPTWARQRLCPAGPSSVPTSPLPPQALTGPDVASLHGGYQAWPRGQEWDHLGERDRTERAAPGGEEYEEDEDDGGHRTRSLWEGWTWLQPMAPGAEEVAMRGPPAIPILPRKGSCSEEKKKKEKRIFSKGENLFQLQLQPC